MRIPAEQPQEMDSVQVVELVDLPPDLTRLQRCRRVLQTIRKACTPSISRLQSATLELKAWHRHM